MKINKLGLSLALSAGLLTACGGGDSRSPDRPGSKLDPSTLRIEFPQGNVLAGTGNSSIPVRMLGLQEDGVNRNIGPELNVTGDNTIWSISEVGSPPVAQLANAVRNAGSLGDVIDILSTVRLLSSDNTVTGIITGSHTFESTIYLKSANFTIRPPVPQGLPYVSGPAVIAVDPLSTTGTTVSYQMLQNLQDVVIPENQTTSVKFCSQDGLLAFVEPQPFALASASSNIAADATVANPFSGTDDTPQTDLIYVIEPQHNCEDLGEPIGDTGGVVTAIATLPIQIIPAVVQEGGVALCAVVNPEANACDSNGTFNAAAYLASCDGLGADSIDVPAGEVVQMVAQLTYTNPSNPAQSAFTIYQCSGQNRLAWTAAPTTIFDANGLNVDGGFGSLISRNEYLAIQSSNPQSVVTGAFSNEADATPITGNLTLNLVDSLVSNIEIIPVDLDPAHSGPDPIYLNLLQKGINYRAQCTYGENDPVVANCAAGCVNWTVGDADLIAVNPATGTSTTASSIDQETTGDSAITATYSCREGINDSRDITVIDDPLVELHLLQQSNGNAPEEHNVDQFSCVGRDDLVGSLRDGEFIRGSQRYYAHGLFESQVDGYNGDPSTLPDITSANAIGFSATAGYWSGNASADKRCVTTVAPVDGFPEAPALPDPIVSGPAASFSEEDKGLLVSRGLLRLSTVCIQAYVDDNADRQFDSSTEQGSEEGSTSLILPAANDDLLIASNDLCETLEPVLTLGANIGGQTVLESGIIIPLVYSIGLIADPLLATLATNDDGGALPVEEILTALIDGDFSTLPGAPAEAVSPVGGLGQLTSLLLNGTEEVPVGLGTLVDALDACAVDPLTQVVGSLLNGLLLLNPDRLAELQNVNVDGCQALLQSFQP